MSLLPFVINTLYAKRLKAIEHFCKDPLTVQTEQLKNLLTANGSTEYLTSHSVGGCDDYGKFSQKLPIVTYEDLAPWIMRVIDGEHRLLSNSPTRWLAKSSGTTNDVSKFIPINSPSLEECHYQGGRDVLALFTRNYPNSKALSGKSLTLGGTQKILNETAHLRAGDLSAILIDNAPKYMSLVREPKKSVALLPDFEQKVEAICRECSNQNVTSFAGVPSWNLVLMKRIMEYNKVDSLLDVWKDLSLFIHGGMAFAPYKEQYQRIIPSEKMVYMETYNASEGFFALQDDPSDRAMLLMLDYGTYYEFLATCDLAHPERAVPLEGVRTGVNYAMIITTIGGLWRYMIGDTVEFTSTKPYKIKITGRTKHFINAFGEELVIDNAEQALRESCREHNCVVNEYTAAPIFMDSSAKGAHQWVIEFATAPTNPEAFANSLDQNLRNVNSDYNAKRTSNATMNRLKLTVAPLGTFYRWMHERGKIGGQNKVPRLSPSREYIESLLEIIK